MKKLMFFTLAMSVSLPVYAQTTNRLVWKDVGASTNPYAAISGCSAVAINSGVNCEIRNTVGGVMGVEGFNLLTLEIFYDDNAVGGGTGYTFQLQTCREGMGPTDCTDSTDWFLVETTAVSTGTITMSDGTFTKTSDADHRGTVSVGINYRRLRLFGILGTGTPGATDKITVYARLGFTPAF